ncbi:DinB/UmuC family translesion DNA polymerase [Arachidicoccus soli]|uniref:DinB/UmuC family translesion DNA polymerase n=1 Tax=Arachidicoccus soli TaxID=2341117 RepID=UPI001F09907F|nr:hypothetical protein [Arachidicoccus soli]
MGKTYFYYQIVRGIDNRPVQPNRATKSVSVEYTYQEDLITKEAMLPELEALCERLAERLQRHHLKGRTITVKFKFHDFTIMTRSHSLSALINDKENIIQTVNIILKNAPLEDKKVRLLGVGISNFELAAEKKKDNTPIQLKLF